MQHSNHRAAALIASKPARIITSAALAVALTATPMLPPVAAYAASQATQDQLSAAQQKIETATSAYNEARTKLEDLQKQIDSMRQASRRSKPNFPRTGQGELRHARSVQVPEGHQPHRELPGQRAEPGRVHHHLQVHQPDHELERRRDRRAQQDADRTRAEQDRARAGQSQLETEQKTAEDAMAQAQQLRSEAQAKAEQENAAELPSSRPTRPLPPRSSRARA